MPSWFNEQTPPPPEALGLVEKFLVNDPLYRRLELDIFTDQRSSAPALLPAQVSRRCEHCKQTTRWDRQTRYGTVGSFIDAHYLCRNCGRETFHVWFFWSQSNDRTLLSKVGQFPRLQVEPRPELAKSLNADQLQLYRTGMVMRHNNYGIGAMPYFRRLVESSTDEMLDLLIEALKVGGENDPTIEKIIEAKTGKVFEKKVEFAGTVLPQHLRPGGANPFALLHKLLSDGLHARSEEECCEIVDGIDEAMTMIYVTLKHHVREAQGYGEAIRKLQAKLSKAKPPAAS